MLLICLFEKEKMYIYGFEKLEVWHLAKNFACRIYEITADFPSEEKFGLCSQLRRASVSVSSNIAEGCSRLSCKDQAHFSQIAYSSLMEVLNQIIIAKDLEYLEDVAYIELRRKVEELANKINALRNAQLRKNQINKSTVRQINGQM